MRKVLLLLLLCLGAYGLRAQDTLKVMQYNLLMYGDNDCAPIAQKNPWLKTITKRVMPDILGVNELRSNDVYARNILNNVLNTNGIDYYRKAEFTNEARGNLANMLFFNSSKLGLKGQSVLSSLIRDINLYTLFYRDPNLGTEGVDTIYIHVLLAHLKAGQSSSDASTRKAMVDQAMKSLKDQYQSGNFLFMGDFNVYNQSEEAFQAMVAESAGEFRFYDPIEQLGRWNNNAAYAAYHTQSTRSDDRSGCASSGGMDDRFDFILASQSVMEGTNGATYLQGTYEAMGQDGKRFNGSLTSPSNQTYPSQLLSALYAMSDHLPVLMDVEVERSEVSSSTRELMAADVQARFQGSQLYIHAGSASVSQLQLYRMDGSLVLSHQQAVQGAIQFNSSSLPRGLYLLLMKGEGGSWLSKKLIK